MKSCYMRKIKGGDDDDHPFFVFRVTTLYLYLTCLFCLACFWYQFFLLPLFLFSILNDLLGLSTSSVDVLRDYSLYVSL
jgi:hypothetical protein